MFKKLIRTIVGDPNQKVIDSLKPIVAEVEAFESQFETLSDDDLKARSLALRERALEGAALDDLLPEAFALVRVASVRATGMRHYDVQIMGGTLLHRGEVVEMRTGEGKTLVATLPLYLNALAGEGVHLVTVNDYLARRDGGWMGKIFHVLGLTIGCIGPQRFSAVYDPDYVNPGAELEDERLVHWRPCTRREAYYADVTYGTASEFGFDYLRDNGAYAESELVQRALHYAVIDEVDNILIDEAKTPLIISSPKGESGNDYVRFSDYVRRLKANTADEDDPPNGHYDLDEKSRSISLTDIGIEEIEKRIPEINVDAGDSLYDPRFFHLTYYLDNALKAQYLYKRDQQYVVQDEQVLIVDESTGRLMHGRRYSDGLHEAIEAKEAVTIKRETVTSATITLQNFFRLYDKLAGMTGTAMTDAEEFQEIYKVEVTPLPTNVQYIVSTKAMNLEEKREKVEGGDHTYYVDPGTGTPVFHIRIDHDDQVFANLGAKDQAIVNEITRVYEQGRPVLVGTASVEHSEVISHLLKKQRVEHKVLNAKIVQSEALIVAQAGRKGAVTISTNMAGRGTDILLGGNPEGMAAEAMEREMFDRRLLTELAQRLFTDGPEAARDLARRSAKLTEDLVDSLLAAAAEFEAARLKVEELTMVGYLARVLQERYGVEYSAARQALRLIRDGRLQAARDYVLELGQDVALIEDAERLARLHSRFQQVYEDQERKATFIAEQVFEHHYNGRAALIRVLLGDNDMDAAQKLVARVPGLTQGEIDRIEEIKATVTRERKEIKELGGLHVVGSERHESRRIDNQLRGRAARQGDPGSSRFFLSLEDELMRRFGGERLKRFMNSNVIPDDMPLEMGVLNRIIENAQERIEGYNFDIRKNVVEYDDVMSMQRQAIYGERRRILEGDADVVDAMIAKAFDESLEELADNYLDDYAGYARGEIDRVILSFSTDATDTVNVAAVVRRLRGMLPTVVDLDLDTLTGLRPSELANELMLLAHDNIASGANLYQLLQATGRFLPILPAIPNLGAQMSARRSGHLQAREALRRAYVEQVKTIFDRLLAQHADPDRHAAIWQSTATRIEASFNDFTVERVSSAQLQRQQEQFRLDVAAALNDLLLESLSALDREHLVGALSAYVAEERGNWRAQIGDEDYQTFQRLLLLDAIDREWRDYLTAMDDLRREISLQAVAQRDPKVEYKVRSYEMFQDMRKNIDQDVVNRYFTTIGHRQDLIRRQEARMAYQEQMAQAGYQVVRRKGGKGVELRRDMPKVGRNDPCPCGSGKKYKSCHMHSDRKAARTGQQTVSSRR